MREEWSVISRGRWAKARHQRWAEAEPILGELGSVGEMADAISVPIGHSQEFSLAVTQAVFRLATGDPLATRLILHVMEILEDLEKKLEALGLDSRLAEHVIQQSKSAALGPSLAPAAQPFSKIPAKQWEEARRRLHEEVGRTSKVLLNRVGLRPEGVEIPTKLMPEIGTTNNSIAALVMVNTAIGSRVVDGRKRPEWSFEEFVDAVDALPGILDGLVRQLKVAQNA